MNIGFYSPYLDTLGGGERYALTLASHWAKTHDVSVFWDQDDILDKAQKTLNIDLSRVKVTQNIFRVENIFKKLLLTRQYDLIFVLSDGSIPSTLAKHNILHFQVPFPSIGYSKLKLSRYQTVVCNSQFTKESLDPRVGNRAVVIYPPVDAIVSTGIKEKLILSVGRFSGFHTAKKQYILLEAFARAYKAKRFSGWKLILAGGLLPGDEVYFGKLKHAAMGLPINLLPNAAYDVLVDCYKRATIYWHAAGYGETDPRWMEHFGITTVEAMSAGVVPIVFAGGGQPEIVDDGENGFLWQTIGELLDKTNKVITNKSLVQRLAENATEASSQFSVSRFCDEFDKLLYAI